MMDDDQLTFELERLQEIIDRLADQVELEDPWHVSDRRGKGPHHIPVDHRDGFIRAEPVRSRLLN